MSWIEIVLMILQFLKQLKTAASADAYVDSMQAQGFTLANGDLLRKIWENREQIIDFILKVIEMISKTPPATVMSVEDPDAAVEALKLELRA